MLTRRQTALYWRTWASICEVQGWPRSDNNRRYALHAEAGCPHSMTQFRNRDFNHYLSAAAPLCDRIDIRDRDKENALHTIAHLPLDPPYLASICTDLYATSDLHTLTLPQLENLRNTLVQRSRKRPSHKSPSPAPAASHSTDPF